MSVPTRPSNSGLLDSRISAPAGSGTGSGPEVAGHLHLSTENDRTAGPLSSRQRTVPVPRSCPRRSRNADRYIESVESGSASCTSRAYVP